LIGKGLAFFMAVAAKKNNKNLILIFLTIENIFIMLAENLKQNLGRYLL
jgi:hypothetical protein